jgi:hypothetical protein
MERLTFLDLAKKLIEEEKQPLSIEEILELASKKGYIKQITTKGKTPDKTLAAQIYLDMLKPNSLFLKVGIRPRRFFLTTLKMPSNYVNLANKTTSSIKGVNYTNNLKKGVLIYSEKDMHLKLSEYAFSQFHAVTKTISEKKSKKGDKGKHEWSHPDIVGCSFPETWKNKDSWAKNVQEFREKMDVSPIVMYSFELKKELNYNNYKESFFQCVSNSSWANEGYLVTSKIENDAEFMPLLNRLSNLHGIGVIKIDMETPIASTIIFPSAKREYLDWPSIEYLASLNFDFEEFIHTVNNCIKLREVELDKFNALTPS